MLYINDRYLAPNGSETQIYQLITIWSKTKIKSSWPLYSIQSRSPFFFFHILLFYAWENRRRLGTFSLLLAHSEVFWGYSYANEPLDIDNGD